MVQGKFNLITNNKGAENGKQTISNIHRWSDLHPGHC